MEGFLIASRFLHFAAAIPAAGSNPEEGAELADKVLRIDPNADVGT